MLTNGTSRSMFQKNTVQVDSIMIMCLQVRRRVASNAYGRRFYGSRGSRACRSGESKEEPERVVVSDTKPQDPSPVKTGLLLVFGILLILPMLCPVCYLCYMCYMCLLVGKSHLPSQVSPQGP